MKNMVVRVSRSAWGDARAVHSKTSIRLMRSLCQPEWTFLDDGKNCGEEVVFERITNLHECRDGLYELVICNEERDWETGYVEDWDYKLIPISDDIKAIAKKKMMFPI